MIYLFSGMALRSDDQKILSVTKSDMLKCINERSGDHGGDEITLLRRIETETATAT